MAEEDKDVASSALGEMGRWQVPVLVMNAAVLLTVIQSLLGIVFLGPPPVYLCSDGNDSCTTWTGEKCSHWSYDRTVFRQTIVTEWNLVCGKEQYVSIVQTTFLFGVMLGSIFLSILSDRIGRKKPLMLNGLVQGVAGTLAGFSPNYWTFVGLRFVQALAVGGSVSIAQVMSMEFIGTKTRSRLGSLVHLSIYVGTSFTALIAYLTRDWRTFQVATTLPCVLTLTFYWLMPESPRWLLAVGRQKEALEILQKAAKTNGNPVPEYIPQKQMTYGKAYVKKATLFDLLKRKRMLKHSVVMWINLASSGFCFYGLEQYLGYLGGDIFVNVAISGACAVPGVLLASVLMTKLGRKFSQITGQLSCALASLLLLLISADADFWRVSCAVLGVVGTGITFPTGYLYTAELSPTVVRNTALGTAAVFARIGAMVAPFAVAMKSTSEMVPPLFFLGISLSAMLSTFLLPETLNAKLPQTLQDGENFTGPAKKTMVKSEEEEGKKEAESLEKIAA